VEVGGLLSSLPALLLPAACRAGSRRSNSLTPSRSLEFFDTLSGGSPPRCAASRRGCARPSPFSSSAARRGEQAHGMKQRPLEGLGRVSSSDVASRRHLTSGVMARAPRATGAPRGYGAARPPRPSGAWALGASGPERWAFIRHPNLERCSLPVETSR
jgi:hypothetical protein